MKRIMKNKKRKNRKRRIKIIPAYIFLGLGLFALLLKGVGALWPYGVEHLYSRGIYPVLTIIISFVTGIFPFSLGQILLPLALVLAVFWLVRVFRRDGAIKLCISAVSLVGLAFFIFVFSWGLNFNRPALGEALGWQYGPSPKEDLRGLTAWLAEEINALRPSIMEDENGVASSGLKNRELLKQAGAGYNGLRDLMPWLYMKGSNEKAALTPGFLSSSGIAGYYLFYSGEGNINCWMSEAEIAFSAMHEEAHRRGYSREDEANFLAAMAGFAHPDEFFRYAALLNSYIYASNALFKADRTAYNEIASSLCDGAKRDINNIREFWNSHKKQKLEKVVEKVNNSYLQASGVSDGVKSYGRMVDLLIYAWKNDILE
ncbi:MAG: DUF3810 domain-containing protein [Clostridiales bacterium]|nr:DUF3810 domain-containing protein [Clostridiales bacterium]